MTTLPAAKTILKEHKPKLKKEFGVKEIAKVVGRIIKFYKPRQIILFGSSALGKKTGDIDMFIVKETKKNFFDRMYEVRKFADADRPFDPIVLTPQEVRRRLAAGDFFVKDILAKGIRLYEC